METLSIASLDGIKQLPGGRPVWAHAETNTGSQKTALCVGFKPIGINTVIHKK